MKLNESAENYLEMILVLTEKKGQVRSIDIVNEMNFSKPSISVAMKNFRKKGYITMTDDGYISLTEQGKKIALKVYERHTLLTKMLVSLGVSEDVAKEDACRMEHDLSEETFAKIKEHYNKKH